MRPVRVLMLVLALAGTILSGTAQAAEPASGTLSKKVKVIKWTGSFTAPQPWPTDGCAGGSSDPICDHFLLKVNLPEGARVKVVVPGVNAATDLDLFVYAPTGGLIGTSGNLPGEAESVEFKHLARYRNKSYEVLIRPWLVVPGTSYSATAKVI